MQLHGEISRGLVSASNFGSALVVGGGSGITLGYLREIYLPENKQNVKYTRLKINKKLYCYKVHRNLCCQRLLEEKETLSFLIKLSIC